jgi:hypothetical protein
LGFCGHRIGDKSKNRGWENISKIRIKITLYSIIAAGIAEVVSLPIVGASILFSYGLALGAAVAIINLHVLSSTITIATESGRKGAAILGYIVRIAIYAAAFWLTVRTSLLSGAGAAIGFLLPRAVMYIMYGALPAVRRRMGKEPPAVYVADRASKVFIKEPWFVRYGSGGRAYLTHRRYKKVKLEK